jgi:hypothetical protein
MQLKGTFAVALVCALALGSGAAFAQDTTKTGKPMTAQQEKMKSCNADAKTKALSGDARKTFMSSCLSGSAAATPTPAVSTAKQTQQEKMKSCNADPKAKTLKGADRKAFMSTCLSDGAAAH